MTPAAKAQIVKALGREAGFDLVGITHAGLLHRAGYYREWLAAGYGGTMGYLWRNVPYREDPSRLVPGSRSVICVAVSYKRDDGYVRPSALVSLAVSGRRATDGSGSATGGADSKSSGWSGQDSPSVIQRGGGWQAAAGNREPAAGGLVAQYARGRDYHVVIRGMLDTLLARLRAEVGEPFDARVFVDTGPLLERELAVAAGLGWFGRNTCLLNARLGSYLLLGEAVTTLDIAHDQPVPPRCGTCTRCVDACPTHAFPAACRLDARRCISYLTIEHRGAIDAEFHEPIGDRVFGCDVCQQVCPYNHRAPPGTHPDIMADVTPARLDLHHLLNLRSGDYRRLTKNSAISRATRTMWRRNAAIVAGNALRAQRGTAAREGE